MFPSRFRRRILALALTALLTMKFRRELLVVALVCPALLVGTFFAVVWASTQHSLPGDERGVPGSALAAPSSDAQDASDAEGGATGHSTEAPAEESVPETADDRTEGVREDTKPKASGFAEAMFVHYAAPANTRANSTYLDEPTINGEPDAFLSVTQNWNPGGGPGTYNRHPVGVWYDAERSRWAIFNQDMAPVPEGAAFNVVVMRDPREAE